jgi:hypothetical protein
LFTHFDGDVGGGIGAVHDGERERHVSIGDGFSRDVMEQIRVERFRQPGLFKPLDAACAAVCRFVGDLETAAFSSAAAACELSRADSRGDVFAVDAEAGLWRWQDRHAHGVDRRLGQGDVMRIDIPICGFEACQLRIDGLDSESQCGRIRLESEIEACGVDEPGIGDERVAVASGGLPFREGVGPEHGRCSGGVEVEIVVEGGVAAHGIVPGADHVSSGEIDDVVCERE